jgi:uncharacterized membrane-anchored protein
MRHLDHLGNAADGSDTGPVARQAGRALPASPDWRRALYDELHARPFPVLDTPVLVSHLAVLPEAGSRAGERELAHLATLCRRYGSASPEAGDSCLYRDFGNFELRWEKHTEFCTWTVIRRGATDVRDGALEVLPADWLAALPGRVVAAVNLSVQARRVPAPSRDELRGFFDGQRLIGSLAAGGRAEVWTAFRLHEDGFGRFLVFHDDLNPCETGRLVQQLLELETYRLMALLTLPLVRECQGELSAMDSDLADIVERMNANEGARVLLSRLAGHAAQLEAIRARLSYRLSATRAYYALVQRRVEQLRIGEMRGLQTIAYFLDRRLAPAVRTCEAAGARIDDLSQRIDRAAELLRTRIELGIAEQNQALLASMDRRSGMQLRLQQAVEGLSVAAISYYVVQLVHALAEGLHEAGVAINPVLATAVAVPVVVGSVLGLVVWLRRRARNL